MSGNIPAQTQPQLCSSAWKDVNMGDEHSKEKKEEKLGEYEEREECEEYEPSESLYLHENVHTPLLLPIVSCNS